MISPTITLSTGARMPLVGHGLWKIPNEKTAEHVYNAIKAGYRLFDGACDYGNEKEAGQGIANAIADGLVNRKELFIVTKLWNTFHEKAYVEPACRKQLEDWGLEYFDLYIMHFPIALQYVDPAVRYPPGWYDPLLSASSIKLSPASIRETWTAMESLISLNLTHALGVSNFNCASLLDLLQYAIHRPATLQIEHHPYLVQSTLLHFAKTEGIAVTAYSSFGPQGYVEMELGKAVNGPKLFSEDVTEAVAERSGKSVAQVLLKWAVQRGVAVIPKSSDEAMLKENLEAGDQIWNLTEDELERLDALDSGRRFNDPWEYFGCLPIFA